MVKNTNVSDKSLLNEILQIIGIYCNGNNLSLGQFAERAGVSKAWISRLNNEDNKHLSVEVAVKLLDAAGYKMKISKGSYTIQKRRLNGKK